MQPAIALVARASSANQCNNAVLQRRASCAPLPARDGNDARAPDWALVFF
jgi:hypothetical protein